jgi:hypothetical protein
MKRDVNGEHELRQYFAEVLHESLSVRLGLGDDDVERYLSDLMVDFLHSDGIYALRDETGRRIDAVVDMVVEGDVRLNADSFEREREVHKHIGDFLLFWSGVFPEFLKRLKSPGSRDHLLDPVRQGKMSYYVASTFDYGDYAAEAPVFRKLSGEFEAYIYGLSLMRAHFHGLGEFEVPSVWSDGFDA